MTAAKKTLLFFCLLSPVLLIGQTLRVLWIGNSYTANNNLPQLVYNLALSGGDTLIFDSNTPGGATFQNHSVNATTIQKIQAGEWDYVVLQAQSQEPSFPDNQVQIQTYPFAQRLDSMIQANGACVRTVFYMTWGRKFGDQVNCPNFPPLCTFEGMNNRLRHAYKFMADDNQAIMAPVGMAWAKSWQTNNAIDLWAGDNSHPSMAGSYLAASVFYATLFRKNPTNLSYTAGLDPTQASFLRQTAWSTVNDSLNIWNIGTFEPQASFSYTVNGLEVNFESTSQNTEFVEWQFGDGANSEDANPSHTYPGPGSYLVKLVASDSCYSDTTTIELNLEITGQNSIERNWRVFPNPASREVMIQAEELAGFGIKVYGPDGKLVREKYEAGKLIRLDFSDLPPGIYQVVCISGKDSRIFRLMKE